MSFLKWTGPDSPWLQEGFYVCYYRDGVKYYEQIAARDIAHFEYNWPETIAVGATSGPFVPDELEITTGFKKEQNSNAFWQMIFGIKGQVYIYVELPTDTHRHGLPKVAKPSAAYRTVSHFEEFMSPFKEPTFITEHFLMRPENYNIGFDAYNPLAIALPDVALNLFINKIITERIGYEQNGSQYPSKDRFSEVLDNLCKKRIPFRPITLLPISAPAEAPAGE